MKLYLSSYHLGNKGAELTSMALKNKNAAVIVNAWDGFEDLERRKAGIDREIKDINNLGFTAELLDLREYFGKSKLLKNKLQKYGLVWITGGNTFVLRQAMKQSGFDKIIKELTVCNQIVYAGYSAASCLAGPNLEGIELCDDPNIHPKGYNKEILWDALGFIDYSIVPHYRSDHPESPMAEKTVLYLQKKGISYKTLKDGEVIIVDN